MSNLFIVGLVFVLMLVGLLRGIRVARTWVIWPTP